MVSIYWNRVALYRIHKTSYNSPVYRKQLAWPEFAGANWYSTQDKLGIFMPAASRPSGWSRISASMMLCRKSLVEMAKGKNSAPELWSAWQYIMRNFSNHTGIYVHILLRLSKSSITCCCTSRISIKNINISIRQPTWCIQMALNRSMQK